MNDELTLQRKVELLRQLIYNLSYKISIVEGELEKIEREIMGEQV